MPRTNTVRLVTDTAHFNPLQLQPRVLLSTAFNGLSRWLREHVMSFRTLVRDQHFSVTVLGSSIEYGQALGFFDTDVVEVKTRLKVMRGGMRAQVESEFSGGAGIAATVRILLCPVEVLDHDALGASPAAFPGRILERFLPDELDPSGPERPMTSLEAAIEAGAPLGDHLHSFTIHRHQCEVADQWAFYEAAALVSSSREAFAQAGVKDHPVLGAGLGRPIKRFEMELSRPYFWLQRGSVETIAYAYADGLALVHRLLSDIPGEKLYGTVIETF